MSIEIFSYDHAPERHETNEILREYYADIFAKGREVGLDLGPDDGENAINEYWEKITSYLPPNGRTLGARGEAGKLVGIGMLKTIQPEVGELKRLYVRKEARGTGLGRKLVQLRIDAAREMGLKTLKADTLKSTTEMQTLYKNLGFRQISMYPESLAAQQAPQLMESLVFFELDL